MSALPVQVVIGAYPQEHGADDALLQLEEAADDGLIHIRDAAIIHCDVEGKLDVLDRRRHGIGRGAVIGGVAGAIVGLLTGPVGWAAGGGAFIGALATRLSDAGFSKQQLQQVADALQPGTSALVVAIDHIWAEEVAGLMAHRAKELVTAAIQADIASQLEAGRDTQVSVRLT